MDMDFSCMHDVATSIMTIQETYGVIPNIYSKGECAKVKKRHFELRILAYCDSKCICHCLLCPNADIFLVPTPLVNFIGLDF